MSHIGIEPLFLNVKISKGLSIKLDISVLTQIKQMFDFFLKLILLDPILG